MLLFVVVVVVVVGVVVAAVVVDDGDVGIDGSETTTPAPLLMMGSVCVVGDFAVAVVVGGCCRCCY